MIDPRAIIDPGAVIGNDVSIGPWTIIGGDVRIGDGTHVSAHVVIRGPARIGRNNRILQFASIGEAPPLPPSGHEFTSVEIGDDNVIREGVTIHRGALKGQRGTLLGDHNVLMAHVHVGHDCHIDHHVVVGNNTSLCARVSVGAHADIGSMILVSTDVPAFGKA